MDADLSFLTHSHFGMTDSRRAEKCDMIDSSSWTFGKTHAIVVGIGVDRWAQMVDSLDVLRLDDWA